jgi:hypothetical protein
MSEHRTGAPEPFDREVDVRSIARIGIWLAVVTVASFVISWGFYLLLVRGERKLDAPPSPLAEAAQPQLPPGPQLQASPAVALRAFKAGEEARLAGWGWVDRSAGIAHVPIERALDEVAEQGSLPSFLPPAPPAPAAEAAP